MRRFTNYLLNLFTNINLSFKMKRRTFLSFLLIVLSGGIGFADTGQTVTVNGTQINKFVTNITFSGDNVTLVLTTRLLRPKTCRL